MPRLLVIDDDRTVIEMVRRACHGSDFEILTAQDACDGLRLAGHSPDVVLLDVMLPDASGMDVARQIGGTDPGVPIIFMTAHGTSETAIEAMKAGAFDYLSKPLDLAHLQQLVGRAVRIRQAARTEGARVEPAPIPRQEARMIGKSPQMQEVFKAIGRVAPQPVTVLIQGESGTGKELVARAIHQHSPRSQEQFLAVNCAAIPESLLESELFGHEKGAFTSADEMRVGKFEQCSGGTIFLDEIGDMTPLVQSKVLRVLQEKCFERVGGNQLIRADVRVIAATNRDLQQMVAAGTFREDLYYRLAGYTIRTPPLRERGEDLTLLIRVNLERLCRELGKHVHAISPEAQRILAEYPWPGNVRELESVVRQALLQTTGPVLLPEFLPASVWQQPADGGTGTAGTPPSDLKPLVDRLLRRQSHGIYAEAEVLMERYVLSRVLRHTRGNQSQAARLLGITRGCLRNRLRSLGISVTARVALDDDDVAGYDANAAECGMNGAAG